MNAAQLLGKERVVQLAENLGRTRGMRGFHVDEVETLALWAVKVKFVASTLLLGLRSDTFVIIPHADGEALWALRSNHPDFVVPYDDPVVRAELGRLSRQTQLLQDALAMTVLLDVDGETIFVAATGEVVSEPSAQLPDGIARFLESLF